MSRVAKEWSARYKKQMIISYSDLQAVRERHAKERLVFCSGSFDLFHAGHVLFLEDCKKEGDILVAGTGNDAAGKKKGPGRPIFNEHVRVKLLDSQKVVDYAFVHKNAEPGAPYDNAFLEEIFPLLKPDVWVINEDATEIPYRVTLAARLGITLKVLSRVCPPEFESVSTTALIKKIKGL